MQYMLMCCIDEKAWTQLPDSEKHRIMQEYRTLIQSLATNGQFRGGGQLRSTSSATTVRMKDGKLAFTDGPFAETKEQLGGYHLVECRNLDEALSIAARIPTLPAGGAIEVRPLEPSLESELSVSR
jgi:hypothetical protein